MTLALTEAETRPIRIFLKKLAQNSQPSKAACRNGPCCVYLRHQRCWFAHESAGDTQNNEVAAFTTSVATSDNDLREPQHSCSVLSVVSNMNCNKCRQIPKPEVLGSTQLNKSHYDQNSAPAPQPVFRSTAILKIWHTESISGPHTSSAARKDLKVDQEANEEAYFAFRATPLQRQYHHRSPCTTRHKGKMPAHSGSLFKSSAVLYETQTTTILSAPFVKPPLRQSASATRDNVFMCRALITDQQVASTYGTRPPYVSHALTQTSEQTKFHSRALIYDSHNTHIYKSIQTRYSHNPYAMTADQFEHKNLWNILKPQYDHPAIDYEAALKEEIEAAWKTITRRKAPWKEPEVTSASFLEYCCKVCRKPFVLTVSNVHWFLEKNLQVPKRCDQCQDRQRMHQRASSEKTAKPAQVHEYRHACAKPWPKLHQPKQPRPSSNASSSSSSIPEGKFWDCQSTSSESSCQSTTRPIFTNYWTAPNADAYDTPSQQEDLFASASKRSSGSQEDLMVNNLISLLDNIYFPTDLVSWSCLPRAPVTFSHLHPSSIISQCPHDSMDTSLKWADIADLPDLFTDSETSVDMPDLQSSSESSTKEDDPIHFPAFYLPDFDIVRTKETLQPAASSEDLPSLQSSSTEVPDQADDNIYSVQAPLCAKFELQTVHCLYQFSQEPECLNKGPELSTDNLIDICFDASLSGPMLIKNLKSSKVPHSTVHVVTKLKAASVFPDMQQMYSGLQSRHQWPVFVAEAHSILQE